MSTGSRSDFLRKKRTSSPSVADATRQSVEPIGPGPRTTSSSSASIDVPQREVEARHAVMVEKDEEPGLPEVRPGHRERVCAAADLDPAVAGILSEPHVVDEAVPPALTRVRRRAGIVVASSRGDSVAVAGDAGADRP